MQLSPTAAASDPCDLQTTVSAVLHRRLLTHTPRPVAVALSGGGDSHALLLAALAWAERAGRSLIVLTVNHQLQPQSQAWTEACGELAARLGLPFQALAWEGEKPVTGVAAAARAERHQLLADAARDAGARVILMGHTASDVAEARLMRTTGSSTPEPREWSPSPVWPEGRGVFLLRPMLAMGRDDVRQWLAAQGETWIDDPANTDLKSARVRARQALDVQAGDRPVGSPELPPDELALACGTDAGGSLSVSRKALRRAQMPMLTRFVAAASVSAGGGVRTPLRERVRSLSERLRGAEVFTATLAGARVEADASQVRFLREPGEVERGGLGPLTLRPGETGIWDGRFEITAHRAVEIRPLGGLMRKLSDADRQALQMLAAHARPALPAIIGGEGQATSPMLADVDGIACRALVHNRLLAACGAVDREPA